MIDIKEVIWTNFLGYGDYKNSISFDNVKGACLIEGEIEGNEEREEGDEKLNGAGKSSIIEAITWGLFGNLTQRENPGDRVINWHTGKNCRVSIKTNDGYEIVRMRKYNGLTEVLVLKNGEDVTRSTSIPAQDFINENFGVDYYTFMRSSIFGQKSSGFLELSDVKIRKVMESLMGISDLSPIVKTAKGKVDGIDNELSFINSEIESLSNEIDRVNNNIKGLEDKYNGFKKEIDEEILSIKSESEQDIELINKKINDINDQIKKKTDEKESTTKVDVDSIKREWNDYDVKIDEYNKNSLYQSNIKEKISDIKSDIRVLKTSLESITIDDKIDIKLLTDKHEKRNKAIEKNKKCEEIEEKLVTANRDLQIKIEKEQEFINNSDNLESVCSKCRNKIDGDHLENEISNSKNKIQEYNAKISKITSNLDKIRNSKNELNKIISQNIMGIDESIKLNNNIDEKENKKRNILEKISSLNIEMKNISENIKELEKPARPEMSISEAEAINNYVNNIDNSINNLNDRISELKSDIENTKLKVFDLIKKIENKDNPYLSLIKEQRIVTRDLTEKKANVELKRNKKRILRNHVDYIRESYRNKKKIKAFWIGELIPEFNRYLKYYLDYFEVEDNIEFDEYLSIKMDRWGYETHSGGECKRIDLSIMFALNDLHAANFGNQSNFMILDEVDGKIDPFTMNKLVSLLSDDIINRPNGPTNIFVISHRKEMKDRFPNKIKVKNKQGRSYIVEDGQLN